MASSGTAFSRARRLHLKGRGRTARGRTQASLKKIGNALGSFDNRDVRPDRHRLNLSLENEPQRPDLASGIGIERGRAVCELDEIMQILPGSSDNARVYK